MEDFRHFNAQLFSIQLENGLDLFPVRKEHKYYLGDCGLIGYLGKQFKNVDRGTFKTGLDRFLSTLP